LPYVRFIADSKTKKLYVWRGDGALHTSIAKVLGYSYGMLELYSKVYCGLANVIGNTLKLANSYSGNVDLNSQKWQWIKIT